MKAIQFEAKMSLRTLVMNNNDTVNQSASNNVSKKNGKKLIFPYAIKIIDSNLNDQLIKDFKGLIKNKYNLKLIIK